MENLTKISERVRAKIATLIAKDGAGYTWPSLSDLIHKTIDDKKLTRVEKKTHPSQWNKIYNGEIGKNLDLQWWNEFELVIDSINDGLEKEQHASEDLFTKLNGTKKIFHTKLTYGIFINQDSYIPKVYEATYKQGLPNLIFKPIPHWNRALFALTENNINVTLVDYSTVIAFNCQIDPKTPLFFWPFFYFTGWFLLIKKSSLHSFCKRNGIEAENFGELTKQQKKFFLEENKIIVERKTDFEWVLKAFCKKFDCVIDDNNIIDISTNEGKRLFVQNKEYGIYCTNPLNVPDLLTDKKYENILTGIVHKNINGLLCKRDFYENNKEVVQRLIRNWFYDIRNFKNEISELNKSAHFREPGYEPSFTVRNLVRELNEGTEGSAKVTIDDLPILYEHKNHFYINAKDAFDEFYNEILDNDGFIANYVELTKLKLENSTLTDTEIKKIILESKKSMLTLTKKSK